MRMVAVTIAVGVGIGLLTGGSIRGLGNVRLRVPYLALVGIFLQFFPLGGRLEDVLVLASFGALLIFALMNVREPGFLLVAAGLALNLVVIGANQGMPVSRWGLLHSDQRENYTYLVESAGAKHHLATEKDVLRPLGDVIPIPAPIAQAVSLGDVVMWVGTGWFIVAHMRRRPAEGTAAVLATQDGF